MWLCLISFWLHVYLGQDTFGFWFDVLHTKNNKKNTLQIWFKVSKTFRQYDQNKKWMSGILMKSARSNIRIIVLLDGRLIVCQGRISLCLQETLIASMLIVLLTGKRHFVMKNKFLGKLQTADCYIATWSCADPTES